MRASSRQSVRRSITSSPTSLDENGPHELGRLIAELPPARLEQVFKHASWADERADSYERLEFLGDSVLELAIARAVFDRFADASEGRLAKIRAHVVSRASCALVAKDLGLGERLAERAGDISKDELEPAIVSAFSEKIEYARSSHVDYKTELQEALARTGRQVHYTVLEVEGPPHDRRFVCAAHVAGAQFGMGRGSTKKAAEQEAAREALEALGVTPEVF